MTTPPSQHLVLSSLGDAAALHGRLLERRFQALDIDATASGAVSALAAQVLAAAARQWRQDGKPFRLRASPALAADLANLGLMFDDLLLEDHA